MIFKQFCLLVADFKFSSFWACSFSRDIKFVSFFKVNISQIYSLDPGSIASVYQYVFRLRLETNYRVLYTRYNIHEPIALKAVSIEQGVFACTPTKVWFAGHTYIMYIMYGRRRECCVLLDVMISSLSIHFRSKHAPLKFVPINVCISHERKVASSAQEIAGVVSLVHL